MYKRKNIRTVARKRSKHRRRRKKLKRKKGGKKIAKLAHVVFIRLSIAIPMHKDYIQ